MTLSRRQIGVAIGNARRYLAEVKWLGESEGCALLAEVLEREERPAYFDMLSLEAFLASVPDLNLNGLTGKHVHQLTDHDREHLATLLRSRCKPVEYASDKGVAA